MKIYLLDINKSMTDTWERYFLKEEATIVNDDFISFMNTHPSVDAIVSPANSYGLMDGGYDRAITKFFGTHLAKKVQQKIIDDWYGEQPVGTSLHVLITKKDGEVRFEIPGEVGYKIKYLIHTPTMRIPERITDPRIVYQCMRSTLIEAHNIGAEEIVIPAFGGLTGKVDHEMIAAMMKAAYDQIKNPPTKIDWRYAMNTPINFI